MKNPNIARMAGIAIVWTQAAAAPTAHAQTYSQLTYNIAVPGGYTKDVTDSTSFRGVGFDFRYFMRERVSVGGSFSWQVFDSTDSGTFSVRDDELNGDVTGTQFRYINAFPILLTSHYHLGDSNNFYVGLGAGAYRVEERLEFGTISANANNWQFGVAPEVGIRFGITDRVDGAANVRWNKTFASGQSLDGESRSHNWLSVNIGFTFDH